jgi:hypothetical protein
MNFDIIVIVILLANLLILGIYLYINQDEE